MNKKFINSETFEIADKFETINLNETATIGFAILFTHPSTVKFCLLNLLFQG